MNRFLLTLVFCLTGSLYAHVPYIEHLDFSDEKPFEIRHNIEKSIAVYSYFSHPQDVDLYTFTLDAADFTPGLTMIGMNNTAHQLVVSDDNGISGRKLHIGTLVPGCQVYSQTLPAIAIVGPQQPYLPAYQGTEILPFFVSDDEGVAIIENTSQGTLWYEKFTMKNYYDQIDREIILTIPGEYKIYIWEPDGRAADYVAEIGDIEVFGALEILQAAWYEMMLLHDGEIHSCTCRHQL